MDIGKGGLCPRLLITNKVSTVLQKSILFTRIESAQWKNMSMVKLKKSTECIKVNYNFYFILTLKDSNS